MISPRAVRACVASGARMVPESVAVATTDALDSVPDLRWAITAAWAGRPADRCGRPLDDAAGSTAVRALVLRIDRIDVGRARDALDGGVDALITRDPVAIAYAATRSDLVSVPLPWDRAYVLVLPNGLSRLANTTLDAAVAELRASLAMDVVREEARALTRESWDSVSACISDTVRGADARDAGLRTGGLAERRAVAFQGGDAVARSLAERLVALASGHDSGLTAVAPELTTPVPVVRADGVGATAWATTILEGNAAAYIISIPVAQCGEARRNEDAPVQAVVLRAIARGRVLPLVETRGRAIVRRRALPTGTLEGPASALRGQ